MVHFLCGAKTSAECFLLNTCVYLASSCWGFFIVVTNVMGMLRNEEQGLRDK